MRGPKVRPTLLVSGLDISKEVNKRVDDTTYTRTRLVYYYLGMASMVEGQRGSEGRVSVFVSLCICNICQCMQVSDGPVHCTCQVSLSIYSKKMRPFLQFFALPVIVVVCNDGKILLT